MQHWGQLQFIGVCLMNTLKQWQNLKLTQRILFLTLNISLGVITNPLTCRFYTVGRFMASYGLEFPRVLAKDQQNVSFQL